MRASAIKTEYREYSTALWVVRFEANGEMQETADFDKDKAQTLAQEILNTEQEMLDTLHKLQVSRNLQAMLKELEGI